MPKFIRRIWHKYSKLGRGRKKKQVWRSPKGRHNKMRERRAGRPAIVSIGYGRPESERKGIRVINNTSDIEKIAKNEVVVIGNVGKKKKIEIAEELEKKGIDVENLNAKKFLKSEKVRKDKKAANKKSPVKESQNKTPMEDKK